MPPPTGMCPSSPVPARPASFSDAGILPSLRTTKELEFDDADGDHTIFGKQEIDAFFYRRHGLLPQREDPDGGVDEGELSASIRKYGHVSLTESGR